MCSDIKNLRKTHCEEDLWPKASAKYGVTVQTLKAIKNKAEWKTLVAKHKLGGAAAQGKRRSSRACHFVRQPGGGRKRTLGWAVTALKEWHARERRHGHSVSRKDMLDEYVTLLHERASQLSGQVATLAASDSLREGAQKEAQACLERRDKLLASKAYRKTRMTRLLEWTGARLFTVEQTTQLSALEEKVRAQLTWQDVDRKLWAMCVASKEQLEKENLVADAASVIAHRSDFVVGMSDQIPLWAKADCKRLVFHDSEIRNLLADSRKNFHSLREELAACQAEVSALQEVSVAQDGNSALRPGSTTKRAHSEDAKFRITYEARQKIRNLCAEGPLVGEVSRGLLVFPGKHCRLSNVDSKGCYISTKRFTLGDTVVEHVKGQRCRALDWAVALREEHPSELSEVDIMLQPASNMDGVLLAWAVAQQGSEEPASLHIRDSFAALFHDSVAATQKVVSQASSAILGKMTQALQVTDTDYAQSFKASFRRALEDRRAQWRASGATGLFKARFEPQPTLPLINLRPVR